VAGLKDFTSICPPAPCELLALAGLRARGALVARNVALIRANIRLFLSFVAVRGALLEFAPPAAGSVGFPRLLSGEDVAGFCARVVEGCGVLLLPSSLFDHPPTTAAGHFRIGLGRESFAAALDVLGAWLDGGGAGDAGRRRV